MVGSDPQDDVEIPEEFLARADKITQERIETSEDEESYANGDWTESIYELAEELWSQAEEDKITGRADYEMDQLK